MAWSSASRLRRARIWNPASGLGYIDRLAGLVAASDRSLVPVPQYADGFAKAQLDLGEHAQLRAAWLGVHDHYRRGVSAADPALTRQQTQQRDLQLVYLQYDRQLVGRAHVTITPFLATFDTLQDGLSAGVPWGLERRALRYGVRASYHARWDGHELRLGFDGLAVRTRVSRLGTLTLPPREGDIHVFGQPPGHELTRDDWRTHDANLAPHLSLQLHWGRWTLAPGVRLSVHVLTSSRALPATVNAPAFGRAALAVRPEPRLLVRYYASQQLQLSARAGLTHQAPAPEDRSAVFGNPALGLATALSLAAGPRLWLLGRLNLELVGFYRRLSQLATRSALQPPPLAAALDNLGHGHSYGLELALSLLRTGAVTGQLNYTLSRSRRTDNAALPERFFDYDQSHILSLVLDYQFSAWRFGARARYVTGSPRSAVIGSYQNLRDDRAEPIFGPHNAARLPGFFALDLRVERRIALSQLELKLWLDVLNVTDHRNVEAVAYSYDYQTREDITGLPILAVLGLSAQL